MASRSITAARSWKRDAVGRVASARRGRDRASEGDERTLGRVEGVRDTERDRLVAAGVADGSAQDEGNPERLEALRQHLVAAFGGLADAEEIADDDALHPFERSGLEELGAQPVQAIGRLVQILEDHDAAVEAGLKRRAAQAREHGEIATAQRTFRASAPDDVRRPMDTARVYSREQDPEPLEGGAVFPELGAHRTVDARDVRPPPDFVQDGRVAVPDDGLRILLDEIRGQIGNDALQAVAAARQDQRLGARVLHGMAKLVEPPLVVAREIAQVALEDAPAIPRLEADVLQRAHAALEAFFVERARRRDYRDSVAGPERARTSHLVMLALPSGTCTQGKGLAGLRAEIAGQLEGALRDRRHGREGLARHFLRVGAREGSTKKLVQQLEIGSKGVGIHGIPPMLASGDGFTTSWAEPPASGRRPGSVGPFRRRGLPNRDEASPLPEAAPDALPLPGCAKAGPRREARGFEGKPFPPGRAIDQSRRDRPSEPTNPSEIKMLRIGRSRALQRRAEKRRPSSRPLTRQFRENT